MALGVVTDEELERDLENCKEQPRAIVKDLPQKGRGLGTPNVPPALRKVIASESINNGHGAGVELAKSLGISESSVSAYQEGSTSTAMMDRPDASLLNHVESERESVTKKAREKLTLAIEAITADKLNDASVRVASGVAKDMSAVVRDMEPASERDSNKTQFVFFVPKMRVEEDFDTIDVKE